jgi:hypothetical protein
MKCATLSMPARSAGRCVMAQSAIRLPVRPYARVSPCPQTHAMVEQMSDLQLLEHTNFGIR